MHKIAIPQSIIDRVLARRPNLHWLDKLEGPRTAHVVVDLQNGFMAPGEVAEIPAAREIVPNVNRISAALRAAGGVNVFIQNTVEPDTQVTWSNWFKRQSPDRRRRSNESFAAGSFGHALWPDLEVTASDLKVRKSRFGAFVPGASDLHSVLQARGIDTLIITGTATNVCCESTARDAMMMNYNVAFVSDGTATHSDIEHNATLGNLIANFADVMTTDEIVARLATVTAKQAAE
ncbi:MAG TPA: isochorismatase family cysteine hydrolase [Stellaceae bacterium]|jgi:ureidoacrylate peracid hydrolase|nr:isochorismatase family cysteine hydrolase [Stellaceae bacterium]